MVVGYDERRPRSGRIRRTMNIDDNPGVDVGRSINIDFDLRSIWINDLMMEHGMGMIIDEPRWNGMIRDTLVDQALASSPDARSAAARIRGNRRPAA